MRVSGLCLRLVPQASSSVTLNWKVSVVGLCLRHCRFSQYDLGMNESVTGSLLPAPLALAYGECLNERLLTIC